jgi:hypothetical protein
MGRLSRADRARIFARIKKKQPCRHEGDHQTGSRRAPGRGHRFCSDGGAEAARRIRDHPVPDLQRGSHIALCASVPGTYPRESDKWIKRHLRYVCFRGPSRIVVLDSRLTGSDPKEPSLARPEPVLVETKDPTIDFAAHGRCQSSEVLSVPRLTLRRVRKNTTG